MKSLKNQFLQDLREIYDAEHRIANALPKMIKADASEELKLAILTHAKETADHVEQVERVFECFGQQADANNVRTLTSKVRAHSEDYQVSLAHDAELISALKLLKRQETDSYGSRREWEIASYGCLHQWANLLGNSEGADLLEQILREEENSLTV